jgi:hypothetical protein
VIRLERLGRRYGRAGHKLAHGYCQHYIPWGLGSGCSMLVLKWHIGRRFPLFNSFNYSK